MFARVNCANLDDELDGRLSRHKEEAVRTDPAVLKFLEAYTREHDLYWVNTGRVSDDWKVRLYRHRTTGAEFAVYDRERIGIRLEAKVEGVPGAAVQPRPPKSHALKTSTFEGDRGAYYLVSDVPALKTLLDKYLQVTSPLSAGGAAPTVSVASEDGGRGMTLTTLLKKLAQQAETGRAGELVALNEERRRLEELKCPYPEKAVTHVASIRVDAGFDIESNWNGERRCIEVKSSTTDTDEFFISENERRQLLRLGGDGWLYRVRVRPDGSGSVVEMLPDPIRKLPEALFEPVVWRVRRK